MHKLTKRLFIVGLLLFFLSACDIQSSQIEESEQITGLYENEEAVHSARDVLVDNLYYAEIEDMDGYLSTIPAHAHADTQKAMEPFFETHEVSHTLTAFEVLEETENQLVVKTKQKTIGEDETGETEYKNHIANVLIVFEKINKEWKITESSVTDIIFFD